MKLTPSEETYICRYGNVGCVQDDLCPDCQFDKQIHGVNLAVE